MATLEGSMAVMTKALESQKLMAEMVSEGARVMDQDAVTNAGTPDGGAQADISSAISSLGRVLDLVV